MQHLHIHANSHYEAGRQIGVATRELQLRYFKQFIPEHSWEMVIEKSLPYLMETQKAFPHLVEEIRGLAEGIGLPFENVWAFQCRDEIDKTLAERCSSVFIKTSGGWIVGHNEDDYWDGFSKNDARSYYFIVHKSIQNNSILYLACPLMIGGETVSINSSGIIQTINTLHHQDVQIGVPKNIIARALSEAKDLAEVTEIFEKTKRASGYCHTLLINDDLYCIESSEDKYEFIQTSDKFVHTNHYLGSLSVCEDPLHNGKDISINRCQNIKQKIDFIQTAEELKELLQTQTASADSIYRDGEGTHTMATTVIDPKNKKIYCANENRGTTTSWMNIDL